MCLHSGMSGDGRKGSHCFLRPYFTSSSSPRQPMPTPETVDCGRGDGKGEAGQKNLPLHRKFIPNKIRYFCLLFPPYTQLSSWQEIWAIQLVTPKLCRLQPDLQEHQEADHMNNSPGKCGKGTQVDETLSRGTAKEYFVAGVEKETMVKGMLKRGSSEMPH